MASQKTKFMVGLFILSGMGLLILAVVWLGVTRFLEKGDHYVTYFDESVQGLEKDSPVKYRGVPIGRVEQIRVAPDAKLIEVVLKVESGQHLENDLVAQLKSVGITGSMFVEIDHRKPDEPNRSPALNFPSEYKIIASRPSDISAFMSGVGEILDMVKSLDLGGIAGKIKLALDHIDQAITDLEVKKISGGLQSSVQGINQIVYDPRWDKILTSVTEAAQSLNQVMAKAETSLTSLEKTLGTIGGIAGDKEQAIKTALDDFQKAMSQAAKVMENGAALFRGTDKAIWQVKHDLLVTNRNLQKAVDNLNRLIDSVAKQPSQLFFGEPPVEKPVQPEVEQFP